MLRANAFEADCVYDQTDPSGYRSAVADIAHALGGEALAVKVFELPSGESVCPYHYEYEEEWLLVLVGAVSLRTPRAQRELGPGELVCFPPGPAGAHKVTNCARRSRGS